MFLPNSRYAKTPVVQAAAADGRVVNAVKRRGLPAVAGDAAQVQGQDKLDVIALRTYQDGTMYWHIADANTELQAPELTRVAGRIIDVPSR
ncbi:MAG TPA: hypothetical protein VII52_09170 [Gemmatimonadaceae bacterium]